MLLQKELRKVQEMIKSKKYCVMTSGNILTGLMDIYTNKVYVPKYELYVEY